MPTKITISIPDGMEIERVILRPIYGLGIINSELVINKYELRIEIPLLSLYSRGITKSIWENALSKLVRDRKSLTKKDLGDIVKLYHPDIAQSAYEKMISRLWNECREFCNNKISLHSGCNEEFIVIMNSSLTINEHYIH